MVTEDHTFTAQWVANPVPEEPEDPDPYVEPTE